MNRSFETDLYILELDDSVVLHVDTTDLGFVVTKDLYLCCCLIFLRENKDDLFSEDGFTLLATTDVP